MSIDGDWSDYRIHVLKELERQNENDEAINDKLDTLNTRLDKFEKTCLQKEGDQKALNAVTTLKIYYIDFIIGGGASLLIWAIQWWISTH